MAYGKRKKGGQRLMEIARAGAKRRADRKKKTLAQARANIKKGPITRGSTPSKGRTKVQITMNKPVRKTVAKAPVTKPTVKKPVAKKPAAKKPAKTDAQKLADYRKNPTKGMAPRNLRTPAQRAADRKRLMNQMSEAKGMSKLAGGLTKDLADAEFATKLAIEVGAAPIGGGLASGAARKVAKTALGKKVKEQVAKRGLTREGRKLRKAGNFRDTKGRIQKIDPNPFKKGGTKPKPKKKAAPKGKNPFSAKSPFNPKGEPAKKSAKKRAKKSKAIEIDIPAPKTTKRSIPKGLKAELGKLSTKKSTRKATKSTKPKNTKKAASSPKKKRIDRMFGKDNQNPVVKSSVKKKSAPKKKRISRMFGKDNQNPVVKSATKKKAPAKKKAVKKSTNKRTTNKPIGSGKGTKGRPTGRGSAVKDKRTKGRKPKNKQEQFKQDQIKNNRRRKR
jgi:hypothetical protein